MIEGTSRLHSIRHAHTQHRKAKDCESILVHVSKSIIIEVYLQFRYFRSCPRNRASKISKCSHYFLLFVTRLLLVDKNISVAGLASLHVNDGLVGLLHGALLDPRLDLVIDAELEHILNLGGRADGAATELDATTDQSEGVDGREVSTVGGTDLNEGTLDLQEGKVAGERHLLAGDGAYDEIESASVGLFPVLVIIGGDVAISTKLEDLVLLTGLAGDTDNLISTECLGEEDTKVAKTTNTDDTDLRTIVSKEKSKSVIVEYSQFCRERRRNSSGASKR